MKWPDEGTYVDYIIKLLEQERINTSQRRSFLNNSAIERELSLSRELISKYFNIQMRPRMIAYEIEEEMLFKEATVRSMNLQLDDGVKVPFMIGIPEKPILPARVVIALHGTNETMEYPLGNLSTPVRQGHENVPGFAYPLLKEGFYVVSPDLPSFGRRIDQLDQLSQLTILMGHSYLERAIAEVMAIVDWIKSNPELSVISVGITGFSLGGQVATAVAACDARIDSVLEIEGWSTYEALFKKQPEEIHNKVYICGGGFLKTIGDTWHLAAAVAPRPQMRIAAMEDQYNPLDGVVDIMEVLKVIYDSYKMSDLIKLETIFGKHDIVPEISGKMSAWFKISL